MRHKVISVKMYLQTDVLSHLFRLAIKVHVCLTAVSPPDDAVDKLVTQSQFYHSV